MNFSTMSDWGPGRTPPLVKRLIIWTCAIAILAAALQAPFNHFENAYGPQSLLSLSWWGIDKGFAWQPFSFIFIQDAPYGLSFTFFAALFFNMYLLWVIGSSVVETIGNKGFLYLYLLGAVVAGLIALFSMPLTGQYKVLAGSTTPVLIILTVWCMAFSEAQIFLFFLIPIKAKWLVAAIEGFILLTTLSQWDLSNFILYTVAIIIGYGYATIIWGWHSPFQWTQALDRQLATFGLAVRRYFPRFKTNQPHKADDPKSKIVDLNTGQPLSDDDAFVDAMLSKISKYGESALSWNEKRRLKQISERRMQNQNKK